MAITNLPTALTSAGNQGDAGDYSTAASSVFQIDYSGLDYTPKTTDDYKNDFEEELQVFINGTRIYRTATDTGIDDTGGLSTAQKSRLTNLNSSFGNEPWDIVTGTKKVQINQTHTAFGDSDSNNPGYPALSTWTIIKVIRIKPDKTALATDFQSASVLTEAELDNAFSETFHMAQEAIDTSLDSIVKGADNIWDAQSLRIKNVATPVNANDAVNKGFIDQNGNVSTVAGLSSEIARLGTSAMATATTGHIPVLANVVEQTVNYTVTVADNNGNKFHIQGGEYGSATSNPALTLIRGYTYVFDTSDSSLLTPLSHPLVFKNGNTTLGSTDGVTTTGSLGTTGSKVTVVVSDSVTITKYSCSAHGDGMGNTISLRHDDFKEIADNNTNVTTVASQISPTNNIATVAGADVNIGLIAGQISPTNNINTVAGLNSEIGQVAGKSTEIDVLVNKYDGSTTATSGTKRNIEQVDTVADAIANVNSVATNISQVTTFADTYHTAGTTEPSGSNVTEGDLWYDTANDVLKVYDGSSWASASSSIATVASQNEFTASNGQGTDSKYFALNHDVGLELVFLNGVRLKRGNDYYCTNSNTSTTPIAQGNAATFVRLETVPGSSDILSIMAFGQIANNLAVNTAGGTFTGGVTFEAGTTHNTGSNTFTMPTTRGTDAYVLTRDDSVGTGGTAWKETTLAPTISSITYPTQNGVQATALAATGAQDTTAETLLINGQNFTSTVTVNISGNSVSSSAFAGTVSVNGTGTVITCSNVTKQASADNYTLTVTNTTGLNETTTVNFSADPSFTTASGSLGTVYAGTAMSTKTITAGSSVDWYEGTPTMPTWMTHFADGATGTSQNLTGTPTNSGTSEVQNFNIIIRDSENQSHNRDFSLTVVDYPIGGDVYNSGGYRYHVFNNVGSSESLTIYADLSSVEYVVVAGGGGGGGTTGNATASGSGGGGAGGYRYGTFSTLAVSSSPFTATVGDKGTGGSAGANSGAQGGNSIFNGITSTGGGGGAGPSSTNGNSGGSGGGGSLNSASGGSGIEDSGTFGTATYQGHNGGPANTTTNYIAGGGGGAGNSGAKGTGGNGRNTHSSWFTAITNAGGPTIGVDNGYIAGGGAGGSYNGGAQSGGLGGGGDAPGNQVAGGDAATYGYGSGGAGAGAPATAQPGGDGYQGIIIIRYAI